MLKSILNTTMLPVCLAAGVTVAPIAATPVPQGPEFEVPVRVKAAGDYIQIGSPGYASPCWADEDGDGKQDLIAGRFAGGKMKVYRNLGDGTLAKVEWPKAEGNIAEVPGVW